LIDTAHQENTIKDIFITTLQSLSYAGT